VIDDSRLTGEQKDAIEKVKARTVKAGRPSKEFGPVLKTAAIALRHTLGLSYKEIAAELKTSEQTVRNMLNDKTVVIPEVALDEVGDVIAGKLSNILLKMVNAVDDDRYIDHLKQNRNPALFTSIGITVDKLLQLQSKGKTVIEFRGVVETAEEKLKKLDELEQALKAAIALPNTPKDN